MGNGEQLMSTSYDPGAYRVNATAETLMRQAPMTVQVYLHDAITIIDERFGNGFAKATPELLGQFLVACALDFQAGIVARSIEHLADQVEDIADQINAGLSVTVVADRD